MNNKIELKCKKHPDAGIHFGEMTKTNRCNYCNGIVKSSK